MKIKSYLPKIILIGFFILTFIVNLQIGLFGDDYYYATFTRDNFWELHKSHYLEVNGRVIVHFLDSIFLAIPKIFWQLLNSAMLTGIAYFGSKIVYDATNKSKNENDSSFIKSLIIFFFGILMLSIYVTRQSVYWTTGSFNYVYPLFMLFWYWHVLIKNSKENFKGKNLLLTSLLAFFASATVEQGGMMSFGLTLLFFLYSLINNKKKNEKNNLKRLAIILLCSFIGVVSVICSPAQFVRFGLESKESISMIDSIKNGIKFLLNLFVIKDFYRPQVILVLLAVLLSFITIKKSEKITNKQGFTLITSFILGLGSQIMMLVSPVYGERNTLFGALMIILFTAILASRMPKFNRKILTYIESVLYAVLIIIATINIIKIYSGYNLTNEIQKNNIEIVNEYKKSNSNEILELSKLADERFGWSMPEISTYHEYWFKVYYEIPNAQIVWKDYVK